MWSLRVFAQAARVEPVVITSSISKMFFPFSFSGSQTLKMSFTFSCLSKYPFLVCEMLAFKVPDKCLTVSFEDIIQAPEDVADRISRLVGSSLRVNHLNRNVASFEYESLFRNHYAALSDKTRL